MSYAARHAGTVKQGQLVLADPASWRAAVSRHEGREVWVSLVRQQHARTLPQNRLYWVWVTEIAGYIGEGRDETHSLLKQQFLESRDIELLEGKRLTMPPSTRLLNVEEFRGYMDEVQRWAAQFLGLVLPEGDQVEVSL
jgi:hypothetical protein